MRYLKQEPLMDVRGKPFIVDPINPTDELAGPHTVIGMVQRLVQAHNNQSGLELSVNDYRTYARIEDILDGEPTKGWYQFDNGDYELLEKIVTYIAPRMMRMEIARNSPAITDAVKNATNHMPEELKDSKTKTAEGIEA